MARPRPRRRRGCKARRDRRAPSSGRIRSAQRERRFACVRDDRGRPDICYNTLMTQPFWALAPPTQKHVAEIVLETVLTDVGERSRPIDDWEKSALADGIAAVARGQYGLAVACAQVADTPPEGRSPESPAPPVGHRRLTMRDLRRGLAYARACRFLHIWRNTATDRYTRCGFPLPLRRCYSPNTTILAAGRRTPFAVTSGADAFCSSPTRRRRLCGSVHGGTLAFGVEKSEDHPKRAIGASSRKLERRGRQSRRSSPRIPGVYSGHITS